MGMGTRSRPSVGKFEDETNEYPLSCESIDEIQLTFYSLECIKTVDIWQSMAFALNTDYVFDPRANKEC